MRVAVFVSGSGTNLQAVLDACRGDTPARVVLVASNKQHALGLDRAREAGVRTHFIDDPANGPAIVSVLREHQADLVVLAGYLKLVPEDVVNEYENRMINIHPALLPAFGGPGMYGSRVHQAVLDSGATVTGVTIHIVTAEYDRGPILAQWPVPVAPDDSKETLQQRVLAVEHQLLPAVVLAIAKAGGTSGFFPNGGVFRIHSENIPSIDILDHTD